LLDRGQGTAYPIYIDDLVELLTLTATHPDAEGKTFNAVHPDPVTLADFLGGYMPMIPTQRALRLPCWLARAAAALVDPFVRHYRVAYLINMMCGCGIIPADRAICVLGWHPTVPLDEGLRHIEVWLHEEGIL
jgi:nucleoside-diphosphate-sugar epimerase